MKIVAVLLIFFLLVGMFARSYNRRTRVILSVGIIIILLFAYISIYTS